MTHNPSNHARVAADATARLVRDVQSGRAAWTHPHQVTTAAEDMARLCEHLATALQQMTTALGQTPRPPYGQRSDQANDQAIGALHQAGQSSALAARHLRRARQTMH
ncbi:hypothetical protein [Streptomyces violaceusniger]|uniref:hypothetical protein n=1 Tax=Streptomyces violaceusniger TaxID=68280 RepID=UPI0038172A74